MPQPSTTGFATFSLEDLVLGLLMAGPKHGYQLYQDYEIHFLPIWKVGRSKFYAALAALHDAGHLAAQTELQDDHPPRKVYQLTATGRAAFEDWLYRPILPARAMRVEFLAKLRFMTLLHIADPARIFDAQIEVCQAIISELDQHKTTACDDLVLELVHDFRRRQAAFLVEWLHVCRARLQQDARV
jgi:DNA-binding PadR family transcriptional regulator